MSQTEHPPESIITTIAANGNHVGMEISPSREWTEWIYDWSNIALIGALIVGAVATVMVVWMGNKKEEYLKRDVASAQLRGDEASARAAEANAKSARANADAELAKEGAAKLLKEMQPRQLTEEQAITLGNDLKGKVSSLVIAYSEGDSGTLAWDIWHALRRIGIKVWLQYIPGPSSNSGIQLVDDDPIRTNLLMEAFGKLNFRISWTKEPHMQSNQPQNSLYIGSKQTPFGSRPFWLNPGWLEDK